MSDEQDVIANSNQKREQPFLYSWNRRLRHVHGVSLRNLNLAVNESHARNRTTTDDYHNLRSPARVLPQEERKSVQYVRSFDDLPALKTLKTRDATSQPSSERQNGKIRTAKRPARQNLRRRSTLQWASADPKVRQAKLEGIEVDRLVDSWFTLHHEELNGPLYISEVREKSMNPDFSHFDLQIPFPNISRDDSFMLKVWSKSELMDDFCLLIEIKINLQSLNYLGRSLEVFHHPLPENCVLVHLSDGIYTSFTDMPANMYVLPPLTTAMKAIQPGMAASFDVLTKLANVDEVLQDALRTRSKLEVDINALLANMPAAEQALSKLPTQREHARITKRAVNAEQKYIENLKRIHSSTKAFQRARKDLMESAGKQADNAQRDQMILGMRTEQVQKQIDVLEETTQGQIRRISTGLLQIFPIEPIKDKTLQFTIRSIHLPNSTFSDTNRDEIAAALGFAAQLVHQLSLYLSIPLPYTIEPTGSVSFIRDDISASIAQRVYPLYPEGATYKFEYGIFLLNKDIEFLLNRYGLRVMEIRQTLPNLKYLTFVLTAGSGELPIRKSGGIRGLLRGIATPDLSRRNSEDSVTSQASTVVAIGAMGKQEKYGDVGSHDLYRGALRAKALAYRKSMLHDAG